MNRKYDSFLNYEDFPLSPYYPNEDCVSINMITSRHIAHEQKNAVPCPNYLLKNGLSCFYDNKFSQPQNIIAHVRHTEDISYDNYFILQEFFKYTDINDIFLDYKNKEFPDVNPFYIDCINETSNIIKEYSEFKNINKRYLDIFINNKIINSYKEISQKYYGKTSILNIVLLLDNMYIKNIDVQLTDIVSKSKYNINNRIELIYSKLKKTFDIPFNFYVLTDKEIKFNRLEIDWNINKLFNILEVFKYKFPEDSDTLVITPNIEPNSPIIKTFKCKKNTINIRRFFDKENKKYIFSDNILYYNGNHIDLYNNYIRNINRNSLDFYTKYDSPVSYINMYNIQNNLETEYIDKYFRIEPMIDIHSQDASDFIEL